MVGDSQNAVFGIPRGRVWREYTAELVECVVFHVGRIDFQDVQRAAEEERRDAQRAELCRIVRGDVRDGDDVGRSAGHDEFLRTGKRLLVGRESDVCVDAEAVGVRVSRGSRGIVERFIVSVGVCRDAHSVECTVRQDVLSGRFVHGVCVCFASGCRKTEAGNVGPGPSGRHDVRSTAGLIDESHVGERVVSFLVSAPAENEVAGNVKFRAFGKVERRLTAGTEQSAHGERSAGIDVDGAFRIKVFAEAEVVDVGHLIKRAVDVNDRVTASLLSHDWTVRRQIKRAVNDKTGRLVLRTHNKRIVGDRDRVPVRNAGIRVKIDVFTVLISPIFGIREIRIQFRNRAEPQIRRSGRQSAGSQSGSEQREGSQSGKQEVEFFHFGTDLV